MSKCRQQVLNCSIILVVLLFFVGCENDKMKDIYSIPNDIDSNSLIQNGFMPVRDETQFLNRSNYRVLYFFKADKEFNYRVNIGLHENNSKGIKHEYITLKKEEFEKVTKKTFKNYSKIQIGTSSFKGKAIETSGLMILERIDLE